MAAANAPAAQGSIPILGNLLQHCNQLQSLWTMANENSSLLACWHTTFWYTCTKPLPALATDQVGGQIEIKPPSLPSHSPHICTYLQINTIPLPMGGVAHNVSGCTSSWHISFPNPAKSPPKGPPKGCCRSCRPTQTHLHTQSRHNPLKIWQTLLHLQVAPQHQEK